MLILFATDVELTIDYDSFVDDGNGAVEFSVYMRNESDVAGFQFDVTGLALTGASGGAGGAAGMNVSVGGATVVGF